VFYPLQTFSRAKRVDFQGVPIFFESSTPESEKELVAMAKAISKKVRKIASEERKALHVAAVFASNFPNHMFALAKRILQSNSLEFDLLKPLILETVNKSLSMDPENAQTGPAVRGDLEVLDRQLEFLSSDEGVAEIYRVISQHIVDTYDKENSA
jgi:predicted short-subunit dehydrogenase-like oxidoreductase (DUF2520 family)